MYSGDRNTISEQLRKTASADDNAFRQECLNLITLLQSMTDTAPRGSGPKRKYDYYTVDIPDEAFTNDEGYFDLEEAGECAIAEAQERSRVCAYPCTWDAWWVKDNTWRVRRVR